MNHRTSILGRALLPQRRRRSSAALPFALLLLAIPPSIFAAVGGGINIPGGGVSRTEITNIATYIVGQAGGAGIATNTGTGINNKLTNLVAINSAYIGNLLSTNAYPIVRGTVSSTVDSSQTLLEGFPGDTVAGPWMYRITTSTNNYNPAEPPAGGVGLGFTNFRDVQLHESYNHPNSTGYKSGLPTWVRGREMTWFNPSREPVMEFYDRVALTNDVLDNDDVGFNHTVGLESGNVEATVDTGLFSIRHPKDTTSGPFVMSVTTNPYVVLTVKGQVIVETNASANAITMKGVALVAHVPDGVTPSSVSIGIDHNNGQAVAPDFYIKSEGTAKAGQHLGFTNYSITRDAIYVHGAQSRIQATNAHFANITNTSVTSAFSYGDANGKQGEATAANFISTVTGTPNGSRVLRDDWSWADAAAGTDTNAISYLTTLIKAAGVRTLANGTPVFDIFHSNGVPAISITNYGSDGDGFAIQSSTGMEAFRFVANGDMRIASPNAMYLYHSDSVQWADLQNNQHWLLDKNENLIIDFSDATAGVGITTLNATTANTDTINLGENSGAIALDAALSADGKSSGITRAGTAGATLAFGDLVVLDVTDSRWELADANSASGADGDARGMIGICVLAAAANGDPTVILLQGVVRADAAFPSFTVNAPIYVSETAGDVTATSPTTEDNVVRILGVATTADEIYFSPDRVWTVYDAP